MAVGADIAQMCVGTTPNSVRKFAGVKDFSRGRTAEDLGVVAAADCKRNPAKPQITVVTVAYAAGRGPGC